MKRIFSIPGLLLFFVVTSCQKYDKVTLDSLLSEMTDREVLTRLPEEPYTLKQFSSYDRRSESPGEEGWWANADFTHFIREEENEGRREFVLFDAAGPGAVVRWWSTFAGEGASDGTVRIYIDHQSAPVFEGDIMKLLSGGMLAPEPLAASVSPETNYHQRGHNLYLPLPYSEHCKITYACDAVQIEENRRQPSIYYNICYRTYDENVPVESISRKVLERNEAAIAAAGEKLLEPFPGEPEYILEDTKTLEPGASLDLSFEKSGHAVSWLSARIAAENRPQALRSTVLAISFDGEETVWIPAGEFFGTGYRIFPSKTWNTSVSEEGVMESYWLMPFREKAEISFVNHGNAPVELEASAGFDKYKWGPASLYFGAAWHEYHKIHTAKDPGLEGDAWHFDVNYVDIDGKGVYAGDAVTVFNTAGAWWGEGDEKIFVDGEDFPSFIGTGSEDYYGYAWCRPEKFSHPFIAQPTGAGNLQPGMSVNMRYRGLDAIPFQSEISSNIELWHWAKTTINYALSSFWYARPGFETNVPPDIEGVRNPVGLKRSDIYPPEVPKNGKMEGEHLEVLSVDSGTATVQSGNFGWSGQGQLWWRNGEKGAALSARFILDEPGRYKVSAILTKAPDYGIVRLFLNEQPVKEFNGFNEGEVVTRQVALGTHRLNESENVLSLKILGADDRAQPGNMAGIDVLTFQKLP